MFCKILVKLMSLFNILPEEYIILLVSANPFAIMCVHNPSEIVQLVAVRNMYKNSSKDYHHNDFIKYIESPTEQVQVESVVRAPKSIEYIKNPCRRAQLVALRYPGLDRFVSDSLKNQVKFKPFPTKNICTSLEEFINAFGSPDNEESQLEAISYNIDYLKCSNKRFITNPTMKTMISYTARVLSIMHKTCPIYDLPNLPEFHYIVICHESMIYEKPERFFNLSHQIQFHIWHRDDEELSYLGEQMEILNMCRSTKYINRDYLFTESEQLVAVLKKASIIKYIENPSEQVRALAIQTDIKSKKYITSYTRSLIDLGPECEAFQLYTVHHDSDAILSFTNPYESAKIVAIHNNPRLIGQLTNPSEFLQLVAVHMAGDYIKYIENPSESVQIAAVVMNPNALKYIARPTEQAQIAANLRYPHIFRQINSPSELVRFSFACASPSFVQYFHDDNGPEWTNTISENEKAVLAFTAVRHKIDLVGEMVPEKYQTPKMLSYLSDRLYLDNLNYSWEGGTVYKVTTESRSIVGNYMVHLFKNPYNMEPIYYMSDEEHLMLIDSRVHAHLIHLDEASCLAHMMRNEYVNEYLSGFNLFTRKLARINELIKSGYLPIDHYF